MPKGIEIFLVFRQSSDLQTQPNLPVNFTHPQLGYKSFLRSHSHILAISLDVHLTFRLH